MRIGLIARADNRGLGQQTWEFARHIQPAKTLVINCRSAKPLPLRLERFPGATVVNNWPTSQDFARWLPGLDAVYTAETPYDHSLFALAAKIDIRTVLHVNPEFLAHFQRPTLPHPSLFAAPTTWMYNKFPEPKCLLPVPVATEHFTPHTADRATNFLHIVGRPAIHDRAGTADFLRALELVTADIKATITCQEPGYVHALMRTNNIHLPMNIDLRVSDADVENYWELYTNQHVLVSPRRFGGLSLPMQEACAAGMPVLATAVEPNTSWLPAGWLVAAQRTGAFQAHTEVDLYSIDYRQLAAKIDRFAGDNSYYRDASAQALGIAKQLSWDNLESEYRRVLAR